MSLLNWVLNDETSQVYGSDINYDLRDVSVGAAIQTQAVSEFSPQAFTHNGIGFKAFILAYENRGVAPATTGKKNENGSSESPAPKDGEVGNVEGVLNGADDTKEQALAEAHFLNNITLKVWIPTLDKHIKAPEIYSPDPPLLGTAIKDLYLYQSCTILDEQHLQSLPPPGSLIMVDYQNRQLRSGLTLKSVMCRDPTFARIIMSEFAGVVDDRALASYFSEVPGGVFDLTTGDPLTPHVPGPPTAISPYGLRHRAKQGEPPTWVGIEIHYTVTQNTSDAIEILGKRGLSYHYVIAKDGTQTMLIDPDYVALHGGYDNERFIGISLINLGNGFVHANMPDATPPEKWIQLQPGKYGTWEPYTDAQISALVALVSELTSKYATIEYVNGHEDNKDGKNDPGPLFDEHWDKFLAFGLARGPRPASTRNRVV